MNQSRFRPLRLPPRPSLFVALALFLVSVPSWAQISITLKRSFIDLYKDRATIEAQYTVDKAHAQPNPASKDGDMHVAGRSPDIGLATVAEIMNAKEESAAVDLVHSVEGGGSPVPVAGAWRIWCEHGGHSDQVQGAELEPFSTTNPDHVFEIHPLTRVGSVDVSGGWHFVDGYQPKEASTAFQVYENLEGTLAANADGSVTISTGMAGYNYVDFVLQCDSTPVRLADGYSVPCSVYDLGDQLVVRNRRMVFVDGTPPAQQAGSLHVGDKLHVLGIPRVSLHGIADELASGNTTATRTLPYEMIVVGIYGQVPTATPPQNIVTTSSTVTPPPSPSPVMNTTPTVTGLLAFVVLAALLGMAGQIFHLIVGLKKTAEANPDKKTTELFSGTQFLISLAIAAFVGGAAGILYVVATGAGAGVPDGKMMFALVAAGYAGTDFIEGFVIKK